MSAGESPRRRSREAALQILYALDLSEREGGERKGVQEAFEDAAANFELPEGARAFAKELVLGVEAHRARIDELVGEHARHWRVDRMAAVDRNVLRLATFELLESEAPTPVVIDEAVELVRRFGDDRSPAFVNGVLDAVARSVRGTEPAAGGSAEA